MDMVRRFQKWVGLSLCCGAFAAAGFGAASEGVVLEDGAPATSRVFVQSADTAASLESPAAPAASAATPPVARSLDDLLNVRSGRSAAGSAPADAVRAATAATLEDAPAESEPSFYAPPALVPAAPDEAAPQPVTGNVVDPADEVLITVPAGKTVPQTSGVEAKAGDLPQEVKDAPAAAGRPKTGTAPALGQAAGDPGALSLTLAEAVLQALANNVELRSESLLPQLAANSVQTARAAFDPTLALGLSRKMYDRDHTTGAAGSSGSVSKSTSDNFTAGLTQFAPTGTTVTLNTDVSDSYSKTYSTGPTSTQSWDGSAGVNVSQSLLKGFGLAVNLVSIRQARLDLDISRYQLQNFTESLIVDVEDTYWSLVLSDREIEILEDSLRIARQQLADTREYISAGSLAAVDIHEAQATVAQRDLALVEARNRYEQYRLGMLWLINPTGENKWLHSLALDAMPAAPAVQLDPVDDHIRLALARRPDINQSRLRLRRGELTVVRTKNGLLPELDFYVSAGGGGGNWFNSSHAYFGSDNFNVSTGLDFNYALGNRSARAAHDSAQINVTQLKLALDNLEQQIQVEVRTAYLDIVRYQKQIEAAGLARESYGKSLFAEQEKLKSGRSTVIAVAIAQNNYMNSRLSEARAIINTIKSLTALYRYDGSLLARRGVVLPGK